MKLAISVRILGWHEAIIERDVGKHITYDEAIDIANEISKTVKTVDLEFQPTGEVVKMGDFVTRTALAEGKYVAIHSLRSDE